MRKGASTLLLIGLAGSPALAALDEQSPTLSQAVDGSITSGRRACKNDDPKTVVVCGRSQQWYRIDPDVLAATRQAEALPPKPQLDAATSVPCSGPNCGGGSYVPLVGMALTALKAAELAADGEDWRDAFRTRRDQYKIYQQSKDGAKGHVHVGVTVGNR